MIKFEEHEGQLFLMLEKPVPLTPDAEFPCLVRLIQDDSPMGKYNQDRYKPLHTIEMCIGINGQYKYALSDSSVHYARYEVIGHPVAEGSKEWALYQMMQGEIVSNNSFIEPLKLYQYTIYTIGGKAYCSANEFVDTVAHKSGWQIYKEPEPQYKVGDWVEHEKSKEQGRITYISSDIYDAIEVKLYDQDELETYTKSDFNADFRKLSPSEVVIDFGSFSGWIKRASNYNIEVYSRGNCWLANLRFDMLDPDTRSIVESLLKAQEE